MQLTYCKCKLRHTGNLAVYPGNSLAHTDRTLNLYNLSGQLQSISRNHLLLELGIIDACKICSLALPLILTKNGNCTGLRQASIISTPGITGFPGKCPIKCGSFIVTFFLATHFTPGSSSSTVSMRRNGLRCGRISIICCVFIIDILHISFLNLL